MGIFYKGQVEYDDELKIAHELLKTVGFIFAIALLLFLIWNYVGSRSEVIGHSMENTLHDGESVWLDRLSYRFQEPDRFDIVVVSVQDKETYYIKRIIGLPGETVYIDPEGGIYIGTSETIYAENDGTIHNEGVPLEEDYGNAVIQETKRGLASEPITLGDGEYFVLGDNRNNSQDSRSEEIGPIMREELEGKVLIRLWPLKEFGRIDKKQE